MRIEYLNLFHRSIKRLPNDRKENIKLAIKDYITFIETGIKKPGLGLKHLCGNIWEIRAGIKERVIFRLSNDSVCFLVSGNHDDISNYLKHNY